MRSSIGSRKPLATSKDRLRRLLSLVPFVMKHQGAPLSQLSQLFGASQRELERDLDLLFMTGIPPYGPGDLIEVTIDDGRVWITMADHLERPQRLTRTEAISLYLRGHALLGTPGYKDAPALASALKKLEQGLGDETLGDLAVRVEPAELPKAGEILDTVWRAAEEHERLRIVYYSASRDEVSDRRVDPEKIYSALGHWYVAAWDGDAGGERLFRVDRIREATATGERFEPRGLEGAGRPLYSRSDKDETVRLLLHARAFWVAEYYEITSRTERGKDLEVSIPTRSLAWVSKLVIRLGREVEIIEPEALRIAVGDLATRTLAGYG